MKRVTAYETSDGKTFVDKEEAKHHERTLTVEKEVREWLRTRVLEATEAGAGRSATYAANDLITGMLDLKFGPELYRILTKAWGGRMRPRPEVPEIGPETKLDDKALVDYVGGRLKNIAHDWPKHTVGSMLKLGRDWLTNQRGWGGDSMKRFEEVLSANGLTWSEPETRRGTH